MKIETRFDIGQDVIVRGLEGSFIIVNIIISSGVVYTLRSGMGYMSVQEFEIDEQETMELKFN